MGRHNGSDGRVIRERIKKYLLKPRGNVRWDGWTALNGMPDMLAQGCRWPGRGIFAGGVLRELELVIPAHAPMVEFRALGKNFQELEHLGIHPRWRRLRLL